MLRNILITACCLAACITADSFDIWNYCNQTSTDCILALGSARYAYGSGYQSGSSKWYLMGGTVKSQTSFVTVNTISIISLPSLTTGNINNLNGFQCSSLYGSNLPQALGQSVGAVVNDELYNFGGFNNSFNYLNDVYNSDTDTESAFGSSLAKMPIKSSAACSVTVDNKIYIVGGLDNGDITNATFVYDTTQNVWTQLKSMLSSRFAPGCEHYNGNIYVFGGQTGPGFGDDLNTTEIYNINSNTWTKSNAELSYKAHWLSASYINVANKNLILIMGGSSGWPITVYNNVDVYDIESNTIIQNHHLREGRYAFNTITPSHSNWLSKFVLMAGGKNSIGEVVGAVDAIFCGDESTQTTTENPSTSTTQISSTQISSTDNDEPQPANSVKTQNLSLVFVIVMLFIMIKQ